MINGPSSLMTHYRQCRPTGVGPAETMLEQVELLVISQKVHNSRTSHHTRQTGSWLSVPAQ